MIHPEQVAIGDRIELVEMPEDPDPILPGTQGTVDFVNEMRPLHANRCSVGQRTQPDVVRAAGPV